MTLSMKRGSLYQVFPIIAKWVHEQSGYGCADGGYAWAQNHDLSPTKADLPIADEECQICQQ